MSGFFLGKHLITLNPISKANVLRAYPLTVHTSDQAVVPRRVYPVRKFLWPLVMEGNASLGPYEETISGYRPSHAGTNASLAVLAITHHLWLPPTLIWAGNVHVIGHKPVKASETWNIADIVSSVISQSAANGQQFQRQSSSCELMSFRIKNVGQNAFHDLVRLVHVCGWYHDGPRFPLPSEDNSDLRLRRRDYDKRLSVRRSLGELEREISKTLLVELLIQKTLSVVSLNAFLEVTNASDGDSSTLVSLLF
jgi:hypothetical protein